MNQRSNITSCCGSVSGRFAAQRRVGGGYALLMALILVAVAGVALVGVSRASAYRAVQARDAQAELQTRWGVRSCQKVLLDQAEKLLAKAEEETSQPVARLTQSITLGGQTFELTVADEQAKLNAAELYERRGRKDTQQAVKKLVRQSAQRGIKVRLTPLPKLSNPLNRDTLPRIGSLGQVFPEATVGQLTHRNEQSPASVDLVTCWGDGRVNFRRAPEAVLKQACLGLLGVGKIEGLIAARAREPNMKLDAALKQLDLSTEAQKELAQRLTEKSSCYSAWVVVKGPHRAWRQLVVNQKKCSNSEPDEADNTPAKAASDTTDAGNADADHDDPANVPEPGQADASVNDEEGDGDDRNSDDAADAVFYTFAW